MHDIYDKAGQINGKDLTTSLECATATGSNTDQSFIHRHIKGEFGRYFYPNAVVV